MILLMVDDYDDDIDIDDDDDDDIWTHLLLPKLLKWPRERKKDGGKKEIFV